MTEFTITDTEGATLRTAHDILSNLAGHARATLDALDEELVLTEITGGPETRSNRLYKLETEASHGAYDINQVLATVIETSTP